MRKQKTIRLANKTPRQTVEIVVIIDREKETNHSTSNSAEQKSAYFERDFVITCGAITME